MDVVLERACASDELKAVLAEPLFRIAGAVRKRDTRAPACPERRVIARG